MNDAPPSEPRTAGPTCILVAAARQADVFVLEAVLGDLGRPLLRASTGQETVRLAVERDPAVVVLDLSLPDMDGLEVLGLLRMRRRTRTTPVLLHCTTELSRDEMRSAMEAGVVDVVQKPFDAESLRAKVSGFVELHTERSRARSEADELRASLRRALARAAQGERDLAATQARLRLATDAASAGLWDLEPRRRQVRLDPQASRMFALPPHTLVDTSTWLAATEEPGRRRFDELLGRALSEGPAVGRVQCELVVRGGHHAYEARRLSLRAQVVDGGDAELLVVGTVTELGPASRGER